MTENNLQRLLKKTRTQIDKYLKEDLIVPFKTLQYYKMLLHTSSLLEEASTNTPSNSQPKAAIDSAENDNDNNNTVEETFYLIEERKEAAYVGNTITEPSITARNSEDSIKRIEIYNPHYSHRLIYRFGEFPEYYRTTSRTSGSRIIMLGTIIKPQTTVVIEDRRLELPLYIATMEGIIGNPHSYYIQANVIESNSNGQ